MQTEHTYANYIDDEGVAQIQALEKETGTRIMAYATPSVAADLTEEQLKKIQDLENKLCARLVAYKTH
jgi:hypothetical protein